MKEDTVDLRVRLDELIPAKTAARQLPQVIERLQTGGAEHLVITRRNRPTAVLVSVERYQQLLQASMDATPTG